MRSIMTTYERFWRILSDTMEHDGKTDSFLSICRRLRVSPFDLEEVLMDELGKTGEEIISIYGG